MRNGIEVMSLLYLRGAETDSSHRQCLGKTPGLLAQRTRTIPSSYFSMRV